MPRTADQIVEQEILVCVSHLVSTLASGYGVDPIARTPGANELVALTEQAFELAAPIPDYEETAFQAGWSQESPDALWTIRDGREEGFTADTAQEACEIDDIEPYDRDVFEHWAITSWLADRLEEKGEKVDRDFAGLIVWARTTTGHGIASDSVMEAIAADLAREYGSEG